MTGKYEQVLHLGCGVNQPTAWHNVDVVADVNPDEVVDLDEYPWPWPDASFDRIVAEHVFEHLSDIERALRECERVLRSGGVLYLRLPMGVNAIADPDHSWGGKHPWTWQTPEFYTGARHWDTDVGLRVREKDVELHSQHSARPLAAAFRAWWLVLWAINQGPGEWCWSLPSMSGEFVVVFEKP